MMDSDTYVNMEPEAAPAVRQRRKPRRRPGIFSVVILSVILAVLTGLAVRISVFGKIAGVDGFDTTEGIEWHLTIPETVQLKPLTLPQGAPVEAAELVTGLEGTDILVDFLREPDPDQLGTQEVELIFAQGSASCTKTVTVTRFQLFDTITVKMGDEPVPLRKFVPNEKIDAAFKGTTPADIPADSCGSFQLTVTCDGRDYPVTYLITEDIPPEAEGLKVTTEAGVLPQPETLVGEITDHSQVTVAYVKEPQITMVGVHKVQLVLTDAFGNTAQVNSTVEVVPAKDGPGFTGLEELHIQVGNTISYKAGITCTDPEDGELSFTVEAGSVDNKTLGTYTAYYTATDSDGHTLTVPRTIVIQDKAEAAVEKYARDILADIITEDMTRDQKIYKVYQYTKANVKFVGSSDKSSIVRAAYEGFTTGKGDCYTYYAMNVIFLNMLGIENLEVTRVGGTSRHWWNLVLHDDGKYYHVDSCPKAIYLDGQTYWKMTDSDLDTYTNNKQVAAHRSHYYTYDKTLPEYQNIKIAK